MPSDATDGANPMCALVFHLHLPAKAPHVSLDVQSLEQKPPASPLAQWNSFGLLSTRHIDCGRVFPLSHKKYAALSPIIPEPKMTVCGSFGPGVAVAVAVAVA